MTKLGKIDATAAKVASEAGLSGEAGNITQTCPAVQLEIGVFFDGTLNNLYNVISRARQDASYQNAKSNPALLYEIYKNGSRYNERNSCGGVGRAFRSVYVEGPGSTRGDEDDSAGYATGMGRKSGVEARVLDGFRRMLREIGLVGGAPNISKLVLDVFGFSRGAAGARYFVNCIRARKIRYDPVGWGDFTEELPKDLEVEIRFLGIFDTVAAIGTPDDDDNDPVNVHLKTAQVAKRIYHLTAGDEYRRNFRLNKNIPGGGDTLELPGAHSDVGGGYRSSGDQAPVSAEEVKIFPSLEAARKARAEAIRSDSLPDANTDREAVFASEGWMTPNEPKGGVIRKISQPVLFDPSRGTFAYTEQYMLDRPWVQVGLSRVALHMMHEAAVAEVDGAFLDLPTGDQNYVIPAGLLPYVPAIKSGTLSGSARKTVLRNYGHVSMKDGSVTSSDWLGHRPEKNHVRVEYPNKTGKAV